MVSIPGYDAWRLAGPPEPRHRVVDHEFTREYGIPSLNDTPADCDFSVSDGDAVALEAATICGKRFDASTLAKWLGRADVDWLEREAQEWWLTDGWQAAETDYADGLADYLYEQRRDA